MVEVVFSCLSLCDFVLWSCFVPRALFLCFVSFFSVIELDDDGDALVVGAAND